MTLSLLELLLDRCSLLDARLFLSSSSIAKASSSSATAAAAAAAGFPVGSLRMALVGVELRLGMHRGSVAGGGPDEEEEEEAAEEDEWDDVDEDVDD